MVRGLFYKAGELLVMRRFIMGNYLWKVKTVPSYSNLLIDRTGSRTVATTDVSTFCIYLSEELYGDFKKRVLIHEITHAALFSLGILDRIHVYCRPEFVIDAEEEICNILADYGQLIFDTAYKILGESAMHLVPCALEERIMTI